MLLGIFDSQKSKSSHTLKSEEDEESKVVHPFGRIGDVVEEATVIVRPWFPREIIAVERHSRYSLSE